MLTITSFAEAVTDKLLVGSPPGALPAVLALLGIGGLQATVELVEPGLLERLASHWLLSNAPQAAI